MTVTSRLSLHQELMLLTLKDEEGVPAMGNMYHQALAGGVLAELLLRGRIGLEDDRKKKFVRLRDRAPLGDAATDAALLKIAASKRRATLQTWISRLATQNLKHVVAGELCNRGVLKADEDRVLLIFKRKVYPELDPRPESEIVGRLRRAIFSDDREVDPRTVILISLASSAQLLKNVFPKRDLKARKERIERVVNGELTGKATRQAIEAVQTAAVVAAIMPAIIATTVVHH
jgi:Golgi phosphoprotein 3